METAFVNNNGAAIGATASAAPDTDHMEESAPVDDDDNDNDNDYSERGNDLMNQAMEIFSKFCETLTPAAETCARLLFNTHSGQWDDEFLLIAEHELHSLQCMYDFTELFKTAKDKGKLTVEVPELRSACQNYITTTTAQPKRIEEEELAPSVNIDSALKKASQADNADEEDRIRAETKMSLDQGLRSNLELYAFESPTYNVPNLMAAWRESKLAQKRSRKALFILSAELFPAHASAHNPEIFKGITAVDSQFKTTISWMLKQQEIVLLTK